MKFVMPSQKSVLGNKKFRADDATDTEWQTDDDMLTPTSSTIEILTKYIEMLQGFAAAAGDGRELKGFPNISSVQRLLLQQSQQTRPIQHTLSETEVACSFKNEIVQSLMLHNGIIKLQSFKKPTTVEECEDIIDYWTFYFPLSKLKRFFSTYFISSKVLLEATEGLMVDSEFLSCDLVDMKWTFFLEGALAQSISASVDARKVPMSKMKTLLQDYNNSRRNAIEQNKAIIANTERHHLALENSISRLSRLFHQISAILGIKQRRYCRITPSNFSTTGKLPRALKLPIQKTYLIYFRGLKIRIAPIPGHPNKIEIEGANHYASDKNNSALVLAMEPLLLAVPAELQILHMRDLDTFFQPGQLSIQR